MSKVAMMGNYSGRAVDKFETMKLTKVAAKHVAPPFTKECFAKMECKIVYKLLANKFNLFALEVVHAWIDPSQKQPKTIHHQRCGTFIVDGETIKLRSKMP